MSRVTRLALGLALLLAPLASATPASGLGIENPAGPVPVTTFLHLFNPGGNIPMNTQGQPADFAGDYAIGSTTHSSSCTRQYLSPTGAAIFYQQFHTLYAYAVQANVDYEHLEAGMPSANHAYRGPAYDIVLDAASPMTLHWFLSAQAGFHAGPGTAADAAGLAALPNIVVEATLRGSDSISVGDKAYNDAPLIGHGKTEPVTIVNGEVMGGSEQVTVHRGADGRAVYEFTVPLDVVADLLPAATGYNLRIDTYLEVPACNSPNGGYLMSNGVRWHTSQQYRPRIEFGVLEPLRLDFLAPQFLADQEVVSGRTTAPDQVIVHGSASDPWGNYDLAPYANMLLRGPNGLVQASRVPLITMNHCHCYEEARFQEVYNTTGLPDGDYTVSTTIENRQHTAVATGTAGFTLGDNPVVLPVFADASKPVAEWPAEHEAPGPGPILALALVVAAVWRGRRQGDT